MKRLLLLGLAVIPLSLVTPMATWADENKEETVSLAAQAETIKDIFIGTIIDALEPKTMYAVKDGMNIRKEPNTDSEILGQTLLNTSFEVVGEYDDWSMITTEGGYAYIKSEYLSDTEIEILTYTEEDLYILAHLICGEAQDCSDEEQLYVGSVVLNRISHAEFPDTIKEVVFQPGQYACTRDGNYYREPTERNWANAKWLLENSSVLPVNVIWQSRGAQGNGVYLKTKWHKYCY